MVEESGQKWLGCRVMDMQRKLQQMRVGLVNSLEGKQSKCCTVSEHLWHYWMQISWEKIIYCQWQMFDITLSSWRLEEFFYLWSICTLVFTLVFLYLCIYIGVFTFVYKFTCLYLHSCIYIGVGKYFLNFNLWGAFAFPFKMLLKYFSTAGGLIISCNNCKITNNELMPYKINTTLQKSIIKVIEITEDITSFYFIYDRVFL